MSDRLLVLAVYPSRDGYAWIVGNKLCRDDIGYASTPISYVGGDGTVANSGQAMSMPCETATPGDVCTWRACSAPQFFGSSCELDCPDVSTTHNSSSLRDLQGCL